MPVNRFFLDHSLGLGDTLHILDEEFRHLKVLRTRLGETIEVINGQGQLAHAEVTQMTKNAALARVKGMHQEKFPQIEIILAQAIPRLNRLDTILEKGTELGLTQLWLFPGEEGERIALSAQQQQRVHHVVTAALKQCGRLWLPKIEFKNTLTQWSGLPEVTYFGDIEPAAPLFIKAWKPPKKEIAFIVGPESGFSEQEITHMRQLGAMGVSLHHNILRTDTAPLVALSVIGQMIQ